MEVLLGLYLNKTENDDAITVDGDNWRLSMECAWFWSRYTLANTVLITSSPVNNLEPWK
jgi:hypothetical protein